MAPSNVVIQVWGSFGDVFPMLAIGKELRRRGHAVTVITNCIFEARVRGLGLAFAACDTPADYEAFLRHGEQLFTAEGQAAYFTEFVLDQIARDVAALRPHVGPGTLIVTNNLTSWGPLIVAEHTGAAVAAVFLAPSYVDDQPSEIAWLGRGAPELNALRATLGLAPVTDWHQFLLGARCQLAAWPAWFAESDPAWLIPVVPVGFLHDAETESGGHNPEALRFLEAGPPPVLISGGSSRFIKPAFYPMAIAACVHAGQRGMLAIPEGGAALGELPASVTAFPPLPFAHIVPRVAAMIHHGGYGVSVRALASGTPQLILASGSDRPDNARRLERLGVATMLEEADWPTAGAALAALLGSPEIRARCAHWARELAAPGVAPASHAVDVVLAAIA